MGAPSKLAAVLWNPEAAWGEDLATFGTRLPVREPPDLMSILQEKLIPERAVQLQQEITPGANGIMGGEFKTSFWLTGHGSTTNTTITLNSLETLLGVVIGNVRAAFSAANTTATGVGTAGSFTTTAASGLPNGALVRIGALGDGRGGGQFYWVASHAGSTLTLKSVMPAAPIAGDIIYNPALIHPSEAPTSNTITGSRFLLQTANQSVECHGCYPKSIALTGLSPGETPTVEITWGVSWWRFSTATFPTVTTVQVFSPAPVAAGSFMLTPFGLTPRLTRSIRQFTLNYDLGVVELKGPGGVNQYQPVIGCARTGATISVEWVEDADSNSLTPELHGWDTNAQYSLLNSISVADGSAVGILLPAMYPDGPRPTQMAMDNMNRKRFRFRCGADTTGSNDLLRSAMRLALA